MWFRVFLTWVAARFLLPRLNGVADPSHLHFRVWPQDLDINRHMNNGRYLQIMDLGRYDWLIRSGLWNVCQKHNWQPVLAALQIRYRLPLDPFERYTLETRILGWEATRFYIEQRFLNAQNVVVCIAVLSGAFYQPESKSSASVHSVLEAMGVADLHSPTLPPHVVTWQQAEQHLRKVTQ